MPGARSSLAVLTLVCVLVWWQATRPATTPATTAAGSAATRGCPLPPRIQPGDPPLQTPVPGGMALPAIGDARLQPLAGFSIQARVLGREDYRLGREAEFSPTDLALGWGRMTDVAAALRRIERGDRVRIDGWLVQVEGEDWRWRSSLTRDDSGGGACELVYACSITPE